jgi:23S rRNA pseudouridine2604 synthase
LSNLKVDFISFNISAIPGCEHPVIITNPCFVKQEGEKRFRIILKQGLNRQIRRMSEVLGYKVTTLTRIRIMNFTLNNIPPGKWRYFTPNELSIVQEMLQNSSKTADGDGMGE